MCIITDFIIFYDQTRGFTTDLPSPTPDNIIYMCYQNERVLHLLSYTKKVKHLNNNEIKQSLGRLLFFFLTYHKVPCGIGS
jgi:hypothetical protein